MITVAAVFQDGKRFEDYLHEIEMIEVDTEFPTAWLPGGLPDDTRRACSAALKLSELAGSSFVIAEGDSVTLHKAWERACNRGECQFWMIIAED